MAKPRFTDSTTAALIGRITTFEEESDARPASRGTNATGELISQSAN
jgi:hypothetical protein